MARTLIDISVPLQNDVPAAPPGNHPTIQYIDHQQGLPRIVHHDQNRFVTAKGGEEALIDLRVCALAGQQPVAGRIDPEPGDATQCPTRHPHQE